MFTNLLVLPKHEDLIDVAEKLADLIANLIQEKISEVLELKYRTSICPQPSALPSNDFKHPIIDPSPTLMLNTIPNPAPRPASPSHCPPISPVAPSFIQHLTELRPSERRRACANRIQEIEDEISALRNSLKTSQPTPESILRRSHEMTASRNNSASYTTIYGDQKSLRPPVSTTDKSERAPRSPAPNLMCNIHPHASYRRNVVLPVTSLKNMPLHSFYQAITVPYVPRSLDAVKIVPKPRIKHIVSNFDFSPSLSMPDHASAPEHRRQCSSVPEICYQPREVFILGPGACDAPPPSFHRATDAPV
ncbi:hypothetical protein BDN70DRAFT_939715 [Pholiota conissans]|uniref:Uncharacterized protein n=1 Tax=Pholiota conissans TaxID=109636 RepID=A0A9P5YMR3_9AGAR|nr:hypothetical protein BDN70DRAFT_939715 [Pholiota conissans]